jgi:hypothetical protein
MQVENISSGSLPQCPGFHVPSPIPLLPCTKGERIVLYVLRASYRPAAMHAAVALASRLLQTWTHESVGLARSARCTGVPSPPYHECPWSGGSTALVALLVCRGSSCVVKLGFRDGIHDSDPKKMQQKKNMHKDCRKDSQLSYCTSDHSTSVWGYGGWYRPTIKADRIWVFWEQHGDLSWLPNMTSFRSKTPSPKTFARSWFKLQVLIIYSTNQCLNSTCKYKDDCSIKMYWYEWWQAPQCQ